MTKAEYGSWVYALFIVSVFFPFKGLGLENSLMRFGALNSSLSEKYNLYKFSRNIGLMVSLALAIAIALIAPLITKKLPDAYNLVLIMVCWLPASYLLESKQSYYRLLKRHKIYSASQIAQGLFVLTLGYLGYKIWGSFAFATCFALAPAIISILFNVPKESIQAIKWTNFSKKKFYSYGLLTGVTMVITQFIFYIDIFLIENLIPKPEESLAAYRTATLIPLNLGFIAVAYVNNDFVHISENSSNKEFLLKYLKNYYKLFSIYAVAIILFFLLPGHYWVKIFGEGYGEITPIFSVLILAMIGTILLRIPAGNVLAAMGLVKINSWVSYSALIFNGALSYFLIKEFGIIGAAYGSAITFWMTGTFSLLFLLRHIKTKL